MRRCFVVAALLLAAAAPARADALAGARAAVERRDHTTAIALYTPLLAARPADADLLIEVARVHGFADRNAEAAALYRRALAAAPQRRGDIVPSLAWQTLWAGDAVAALALFAGLPPSADVLDGSGQAQQMLGRDRAAAAAFLRALALSPQPAPAALRRRAAQALVWAGFEDRAVPLLADAADADGTWLRDATAGRTGRRYAFGSVEHAIDRDRLESWAFGVGHGWRPAGIDTAELRLRQLKLTDAAGTSRGAELQGLLRWRFGDVDSAAGTWWPGLVLRLRDAGSWQPATGLVRTTWVRDDRLRVDAEAGRELVETPRALAEHVHVDSVSLGADWRLAPQWLATAALAQLRFDDGNRRERMLLRAEWRAPLRQPRVSVGAEWMQFDASRPSGPALPSRGYWNPARYAEQRLYTALEWDRRPWQLNLRLALGHARERDGWGNTSTGHPNQWQLALAHELSPGLRLQLAASGSGSSLALGSGAGGGGAGYWRRSLSAGVIGWF